MYHTPPPPSPPPPPPPSPPPPPPPPRPASIKWSLPIGYKFRPSDKELVVDYLDKKIKNLPLPCDFVINEVMLYDYTPDHLAAVYEDIGDNAWYFFTPRDRKFKLGKIPNRTIAGGDGYWRATGAGKPVMDEGVVVGFKRNLVFYRSGQKYECSLKTKWLMNEYYMDSSQSPLIGKADESSSSMRLDWALCRVYKRYYKKGGALPSCIGPQQPLSSAAPPQKWSDSASTSGDFSQTSPMYSEDYKKEGVSTVFPQLISSELPQKWSDSAPTSGDCRQTSPMYDEDYKKEGASTIFPQLIPSERPHKCSDFAPTSSDFRQTSPMYYEDYKTGGASTTFPHLISSELPLKWSDSAPTNGDCSQMSPMYYDDHQKEGASTTFPQLIPSELPQKWSDFACTSGEFKRPGPPTPPQVLNYGGGKEAIDTKEEIKSNYVMKAPESELVSATSDTEKERLWLEELNQLFQWSPPKMYDF